MAAWGGSDDGSAVEDLSQQLQRVREAMGTAEDDVEDMSDMSDKTTVEAQRRRECLRQLEEMDKSIAQAQDLLARRRRRRVQSAAARATTAPLGDDITARLHASSAQELAASVEVLARGREATERMKQQEELDQMAVTGVTVTKVDMSQGGGREVVVAGQCHGLRFRSSFRLVDGERSGGVPGKRVAGLKVDVPVQVRTRLGHFLGRVQELNALRQFFRVYEEWAWRLRRRQILLQRVFDRRDPRKRAMLVAPFGFVCSSVFLLSPPPLHDDDDGDEGDSGGGGDGAVPSSARTVEERARHLELKLVWPVDVTLLGHRYGGGSGVGSAEPPPTFLSTHTREKAERECQDDVCEFSIDEEIRLLPTVTEAYLQSVPAAKRVFDVCKEFSNLIVVKGVEGALNVVIDLMLS